MISFEDFKKLDLRTAKIVEVKEHPNADKLYVLRVDVGGEEKQIIAGIKEQYQADDLVDKTVIVINNLEPATIRGEESNGMLLVAGSEEGPVILVPEKDVPSGLEIR